MDTRRGARRQLASESRDEREQPRPIGGADFAMVIAKLDAVLTEQHELRRLVHRITVPVDVVNIAEAAKRLSRCKRTVKALVARGIFTDGRAPENRVRGADLVFFADEIEVYRTEGEKGVKRLRKELGRDQP